MSDRCLLHACSIALKWSDMDAQGHINHVEQIRYMEECRVQWLQQVVLDVQGYVPVVVKVQAEYLEELVYPGEVNINMYGSDMGNSSFITHYDVIDVNNQHLASRGNAKIIMLDSQSKRPVSVPDAIRKLF